MLWACLYFPNLPIDRQTNTLNSEIPTAVIQQSGSRKLVMACNACAQALGIKAGQSLNSAYAIAPDLQVNDYIEDEQETHLNQLALWAMQFSSWVTPRMPDTLLLEIQASLKLFGGLDSLLLTFERQAEEQGLTVTIGVAPTPTTATLFAIAGQTTPIRSKSAMRAALLPVSVAYLGLDEFTLRGLHQSGIRTLRQLIDIPPAALTRRFGHQCTDIIYKLNGTLPDPCPAFKAPETFTQAFDLALEAPDTQSLSFPLNRLLNAFGGYMKSNDCGVKVLIITLYHHRHPPVDVVLSFLNATADAGHLLKIARERLASTVLAEPVTRIRIHAESLAAVEREGKDLFQKSQAQSSSIQQVLDNLMARLGKDKLYTAMPGDDHRPEKAWMMALLEAKQAPSQWPARPLWLLPEPQPANKPLQIHTQAERIENGWWDKSDVRRDYHIASNENGSYFWVYRLRHEPSKWYVHGLFS